ncbi:hypothetical protein GCM10022224_088090 [Nonomuraea antimicrobica]|uniref:Enoyl-(Acyl carrier protein) reductase n=1 Tax=Nonomuraea antimicrobica TaxID=561173 RepID=A0ABP7DQT4_9ACTN
MRTMLDGSSLQRLGIPGDIAAVTAFLFGPDSAFITGTDLLVDGGCIAALRAGAITFTEADAASLSDA